MVKIYCSTWPGVLGRLVKSPLAQETAGVRFGQIADEKENLKVWMAFFFGAYVMKSENNVLRTSVFLMVIAVAAASASANIPGNLESLLGDAKPLNISKSVVGGVDQVEIGDEITYRISYDNNNNDIFVTWITITDTLPDEVTFVEAEGDGIIGSYDDSTHTYTWEYIYLLPGLFDSVDITVRINSNAEPDQLITNMVTIDSDDTGPSSASVDVVVEPEELPQQDIYLDDGEIQIIPGTISSYSLISNVMAIIRLPENVDPEDIKDSSLTIYPGGIKSSTQIIGENNGRTVITALFDKNEMMSDVPSDYSGTYEMQIVGRLVSGWNFYGNAKVTISEDQDIRDFIPAMDIRINKILDYGNPKEEDDLTYKFSMEIEAAIDAPFATSDMELLFDDIEFVSPDFYLFRIPTAQGAWSSGVWRSFEYDVDLGIAKWEYIAESTNSAALSKYGDGEYTIYLKYLSGGYERLKVWFGIPDSENAIPQTTQQPIMISPPHGETVETPVLFAWEPCTDTRANEVRLGLHEKLSGFEKELSTDTQTTGLEPVLLINGAWQANLGFGQWHSYVYKDGITVESGKYSRSTYEFMIVDYPASTYEVWGGNTFIGLDEEAGVYWGGGYENEYQLVQNNYVKLGESRGLTATFSGNYRYYFIGTRGQFLLDCIQGPNQSYYEMFKPNFEINNIINPDNLLGPADGRYAKIGSSELRHDYSGYIVFANPANWSEFSTITDQEREAIGDVEIVDIDIIPDTVRRDGTLTGITVVLELPEDIGQVVDVNELLVLYPADQYEKGIPANSDQLIIKRDGKTMIVAVFDKEEVMAVFPGYGQVNLRVVGKFESGSTFYGEGKITVTRFAGN
ncbi:MAG: isopeptide-forming domain-containing fimbrial protein [Sedimentisphaerales bacterium]|nr:isopeptide-forming domain-containing fimbrial protein [Sedimentisphaerales bacterium]